MTARILVAYGSKHGSTGEVAAAIAERLRAAGFEAERKAAAAVDDVGGYDAVILGGALYTGRWHADAVAFLRRHARELDHVPFAVFALGPRSLEPADLAASRKQLEGALARSQDLEPVATAVFGGVVDPKKLRFPFNRLPACDARDWDDIAAFALRCAEAFGFGKPAESTRPDRSELQRTPR